MDGNRKGLSIRIAYLPSVFYMFRVLTGKTIGQLKSYLRRKILGKGKEKVLQLFSGLKNPNFATSIQRGK